jgi:uncharacterized protein (TIGR03067 family)
MRTAIVSVVLLLAVGSTLAAPAPIPKRSRPDRTSDYVKIEGEWARTAVYFRRSDGWKSLDAPPHAFTFKEDQLIRGNLVERFTLHPHRSPRGIDFASNGVPDAERGVYSIEGDTLTIVVARRGEQRPESLDDGATKIVFRRKR